VVQRRGSQRVPDQGGDRRRSGPVSLDVAQEERRRDAGW
jgi:hypothetical protein